MKYDCKSNKELFAPKREFSTIEVPPINYLTFTGFGNPNTVDAYKDALVALYSVSYATKFHSKNVLRRDFVVAPLEGQWWAEDMDDFITRKKENWSWKMMISQPDWIDKSIFEQMREQTFNKKGNDAVLKLNFETLDEGLCVQIMHIGPYDDEGPILDKMHNDFIPNSGLRMRGFHHEIYLGDPRKTAPEKLKTILRQPVARI